MSCLSTRNALIFGNDLAWNVPPDLAAVLRKTIGRFFFLCYVLVIFLLSKWVCMVPGRCSLEPRPWPRNRVWNNSDNRCTQFGTGHLVLAVWRAGWVWRGAWALSFGNRRLRYGVIPMTEALILGLRTLASSQGLPPAGLLQ